MSTRSLADIAKNASARLKQQARTSIATTLDDARNPHPKPQTRPIARKLAPLRTPKVTPIRALQLQLANGHRTAVNVLPAVASQMDLVAFGRVADVNAHRTFNALNAQSQALETLSRSQASLAAEVAEMKEQIDQVIVGVFQQLQGLGTQLKGTKRSVQKQQATATNVQKVSSVVSSMQVAAYGETGRLLSTNNLLLAGNQMLWSFIAPLLQGLGFPGASAGSLVDVLAPLGSLVTSSVVLGTRQHVRFVSGVANFVPGQSRIEVSLQNRIAPALWSEFKTRTDVPVSTTPIDPVAERVVRAVVSQGTLILSVGAGARSTSIRLAWMVDTGVSGG